MTKHNRRWKEISGVFVPPRAIFPKWTTGGCKNNPLAGDLWLMTLYVMQHSAKVRVKVSLRESSPHKAPQNYSKTKMCVCVCVCVCVWVCVILCVCKSCPAEDFIPRLKAACHILTHSWMHSLNYNCESCSNMTRLKPTLRSCYRDELWLKKILHMAVKVISGPVTTIMAEFWLAAACPLSPL